VTQQAAEHTSSAALLLLGRLELAPDCEFRGQWSVDDESQTVFGSEEAAEKVAKLRNTSLGG
jgi:hypothetical protein